MTPIAPHDLVHGCGGRYAAALGIDLAAGSGERFRWFVAATLYGTRISEQLASRTWREFAAHNVLTPQRMIDTGWDGLVAILDAGGYTRYDFKTATKLLAVCATLLRDYSGDLDALHAAAAGPRDLEVRLKALAAAQALGYLRHGRMGSETALPRLQQAWADDGQAAEDFADFEAALVREGLRLRRTEKRKNSSLPQPLSREREREAGARMPQRKGAP